MTAFSRTRSSKFSAMSGQTVVEFKEDDGERVFTITASRAGVVMVGTSPLITTEEELQNFAKVLSGAWAEKKKLTPKIEKATELPKIAE